MMASHLSDGCHKAEARQLLDGGLPLGRLRQDVGRHLDAAQFDWGPAVDGVLKAGMQKESMFLVTYEKEGALRPPPPPPPFSPSALSSVPARLVLATWAQSPSLTQRLHATCACALCHGAFVGNQPPS